MTAIWCIHFCGPVFFFSEQVLGLKLLLHGYVDTLVLLHIFVSIVYRCLIVMLNPLNTKRRLLFLKTQFVQCSKHFHLGYKNQSVYAVSGTSRCLFSDKYKTHKYSVDRTYSC